MGPTIYCAEGGLNTFHGKGGGSKYMHGGGLNILHREGSKYIARKVGLNILHGGGV